MFLTQVLQRSASFVSTNTPESELLSTATPASEVSSLGGQSSDSLAPNTPEPEPEAKPSDGRRTALPSVMVGDDSSLFKILKDNIGKDLSSIAFPVSYNEPLTFLQRLAEDLEYVDLLIQAAQTQDPTERTVLVAAFAISSYACTKYRPGRKPFNPMLGETFEFQDDKRKFIAEKTSHHPPIMACHAEGEGWEYWATNEAKNKLNGKSFEVVPIGWTHLRIGADHYRWDKPSSFVRNIISGKDKYFEHVGPMTIENARTGSYVDVGFKEASLWNKKNKNSITGTVFSSSDVPQGTLDGTWDHEIHFTPDRGERKKIWTANAFPPNAPRHYGFTSFATGLNELTPELAASLPPTDSRRRPDPRLLEEGKLEEAEAEKVRLEEAQRDRRKRGVDVKPRWFEKVSDGKGEEGQEWVFKKTYWSARETEWVTEGEALW